MRGPLIDRFMAKVYPCPMSGCWLWGGFLDRDGYGQYTAVQGTTARAHRVAYELLVGAIPAGLELDHLCRNRACVNPEHMRVATRRENTIADGAVSPTALNARKAECPKCGGEYTVKKGGRECRPCKRAYNKLYRERRGNDAAQSANQEEM